MSLEKTGSQNIKVLTPEAMEENRSVALPLYLNPIEAGFPSPAEDYVEDFLDLHKMVVRNQVSTFFLRVTGNSMIGAGINNGDLLVVDRSIPPTTGKIVIASLEGELTVKRLKISDKRVYLKPENPKYSDLDITEIEDTVIWGVVTYVIHKF
jgi:DNA polymerase V